MKLKNILEGVDFKLIKGDLEININNIAYDSRKIKQGDMFVCIEGFLTDGHKYIDSAINCGATVIVCTKLPAVIGDCTVILTKDSRKALSLIAANYFDKPAEKMKIIGITGTNGKTTSAFMIKRMLEVAGHKVGLIGTIANYIGDKKIKTERTTPESLELQQLFNEMVLSGVTYCVMEVSSHSLYLDRVYGIRFEEGVFTNLTRDHLDFHKTFENYYNAKLILFKNSKTSIINIDDEYGKRVFEDINNEKLTYAIENKEAKVKAENILMNSKGVNFDLVSGNDKININIKIPGRYNVYNSLGCAAVGICEKLTLKQIKEGLLNSVVPGRLEAIGEKFNLDFEIILDYAHTPDALNNVLKTAREFTRGRLISVFGCGGDRDKTKRPIMGEIGTDLSDFAIITSDNPRSEEPMDIINDIMVGVKKDNMIIEVNRKEAIKKAILEAKKDDVIVIAGKGHEDYQVLKNETIHFDEREVIAQILKELF